MGVAPESLAESKSRVETKSQKSIDPHGGVTVSEVHRRGGLDAADGVNTAD